MPGDGSAVRWTEHPQDRRRKLPVYSLTYGFFKGKIGIAAKKSEKTRKKLCQQPLKSENKFINRT
ncbi:MAG: hypothetical protein SPG74_05040 [Eubacteriales bacterium]|nr:hypothetical protein [Eubacteriales bacterium]